MRLFLLTFLFASTALGQSAGAVHKALGAEAKRIETWSKDKALVDAVKAQNARDLSLADIQKIDEAWRAGTVLKDVTAGACADRLRELMREHGYYVEAFVSDDQGALVCANAPTSDYWQGDEPKWSRAFDGGRGAVFIDRPRYDESTKATIGQISLPIMEAGKAIGVITVGVVAEKLPAAN